MSKLVQKLIQSIFGFENDQPLKRYLIKGISWTFVLQLFTMMVTFGTGLLLARLLGAEEYGRYTYVFTWITVLATAGTFGVDDLLIKDTPSYLATDKKRYLKGLMITAPFFVLLLILVLGAIFWFWISNSHSADFRENRSLFAIGLIALPLFSLSLVFLSAIRGLQHVLTSQIPDRLIKPVLLLLLLLLFYWLDPLDFKASQATIAGVISFGVMFLASLYLFFHRGGKYLKPNLKPRYDFNGWFHHLSFFFLASFINALTIRMDILLLGKLEGMEEVGIYNIALKLGELILLSFNIVITVIAPLFSKFHAQNQLKDLQKLYTKSTRLMLLPSLGLLFIYLFFGQWILSLFGASFQEGYTALLILGIAQLGYVFIGPSSYLLMMVGYGKSVFYILLATMILSFILEWVLIPVIGMEGAAIGRGIGLILSHAATGWLVYRKIGIRPGVL